MLIYFLAKIIRTYRRNKQFTKLLLGNFFCPTLAKEELCAKNEENKEKNEKKIINIKEGEKTINKLEKERKLTDL